MKRNILLSFSILCACGLSACSVYRSHNTAEVESEERIDATVRPYDRCGVDGIGCNDSALIDYTKTEADYRAYGERTKRDHLYTQAAAGNNLTATIPPDIEEDIVADVVPVEYEKPDTFAQATCSSFDPDCAPAETYYGQVGLACGVNCDEYNQFDEATMSEFTEESFDIDDYLAKNGGENIEFVEIGEKAVVAQDMMIEEEPITDDSILTWDAKEGDNLRELLSLWSAKSGWKLLWNTNRNYVLSAGVMFKGKFTDVSSALIRAFARARPAPIATFYKGNRVIVVETMENENAY